MYDSNTGYFIKPDAEKADNEYEWAETSVEDGNKKITDWNTWMRAFSYYMRDIFNFTIASGDGSSVGRVEFSIDDRDEKYKRELDFGFDNDWSNEDYGRTPIADEDCTTYRMESPFRPAKIRKPIVIPDPTATHGKTIGTTEVLYYTDGTILEDGKYNWTGKWNGTEKYDDTYGRFDILLTSSFYDNLGLRFKYPITTTGVKSNNSKISKNRRYVYGTNTKGRNSIYYTTPGVIPIKNKKQVAKLINRVVNTDNSTSLYSNSTTKGYVTFLKKTSGIPNFVSQEYYTLRYSGYTTTDYSIQDFSGIPETGDWGEYDLVPEDPSKVRGDTQVVGIKHNYFSDEYILSWVEDEKNGTWDIKSFPVYRQFTIPWSKNFSLSSGSIFEEKGFNTIQYYKTNDNSVLVIEIINPNTKEKLFEFCFTKNIDESSNLMIGQNTNSISSYYWNDKIIEYKVIIKK